MLCRDNVKSMSAFGRQRSLRDRLSLDGGIDRFEARVVCSAANFDNGVASVGPSNRPTGESMKTVVAASCALALAACTSTNVRPIQGVADVKQVCIQNNPAVIVDDFVPVLRDGFNRHGIATSVVDAEAAKQCSVTLTYTALRSWDFKPYLSHAELRLWRDGLQIGSADYHLKGGGGFALTKWQGTKAKMDPVIDQLLGGTATQ